jgi:hypothetical protein
MKVSRLGRRLPGLAVAVLLLGAVAPASAQDKGGATGDKSIQVQDQDSMASVLKRLEGRTVKIRLAGAGEELTGKLQKVGKDVAHLTDLAGREFYDAVVRIDHVAAVSVQVRGR